jgi:serine/threonine protein kinase
VGASLGSTLAGAGTPAYMAPEQHAGQAATAAADQFAFSVALYEALYGLRPYPAERLDELAAAKALGYHAEPPPGAMVPRRVWHAIRRGLAPQPRDRWPSMRHLCDALERDPRRRPLRLVAVGVVAAVLGVALLGAIMQIWMMLDWMPPGRR